MEMRWYEKTPKREDFTDKEWELLCRHFMDPEPPLEPKLVLQYRAAGGIWRDVPYVNGDESHNGEQ